MTSILLTLPAYADPDLPWTIDSAIRKSSGLHNIHISVVEQLTGTPSHMHSAASSLLMSSWTSVSWPTTHRWA